MTYAVGWIVLKSIAVMHSYPTAYVIKHFNRLLNAKIHKPWQTLKVYSSKTMHQIYLKFSVNVASMVLCSKPLTNVSLHKHFSSFEVLVPGSRHVLHSLWYSVYGNLPAKTRVALATFSPTVLWPLHKYSPSSFSVTLAITRERLCDIIFPDLYQLIFGTGSPVAMQTNSALAPGRTIFLPGLTITFGGTTIKVRWI